MKITVLAGVLSVTAVAVGVSVLQGPVMARLAPVETPQVTVARMHDTQVSAAALERLLGPQPAPALVQSLQTLDAMARQEALRAFLVAQARREGLHQALAARMQRAGEQVLVEAFLNQRATPPQDFPSEALARSYYDANPDLFETPPRYRLAHIWLARPQTEAEVSVVRVRAQELARQAAHQDFAQLAREASDNAVSAARGGALGWVTAAQVRQDVRDVVTALPPGTVSPAIELPDGWHILRVAERAEASVRPFDELRAQIRDEMRAAEATRRREAYLGELVRVHPITVDEIALRDWQSLHLTPAP